VKERTIKDLPASVNRRLLNQAREQGLAFQDLCQRFAMERFLYRLSVSPHADRFVLKGALMLFVWNPEPSRQTMDIDLLGRVANDPALVRTMFRDICAEDVAPDGMTFDRETVDVEVITREATYEGVRVSLRGRLGNTRVLIRVDIGFGDRVVPEPEMLDYPTLLDFPAPRLRAYGRETAIAEKLHAMVQLGRLNSRMKDFFDIWSLSRSFAFDGRILVEAVRETFAGRGHQVPPEPLALTDDFGRSREKHVQWTSFLRKRRVSAPADFAEVMEQVRAFLLPIVVAVASDASPPARWTPPGPWASQ